MAESVKEVLRLIKSEGWSLYKVSTISYTLQHSERLRRKFLEDPAKQSVANIGQPFIMPRSIEIVAVNYILSMQDVGFSLTVNHIKCVAFKVVEAAGITHLFL